MTKRHLPHPLTIALLAALSLPVMAQQQQQSAQAPSAGEKSRVLDAVTVTGSRIKRAQAEESLPVTTLTKTQIDAQGITSAEQLLGFLNVAGNGNDNLSANVGLGGGDEMRSSRGVSGANLRGQGSDATLVLLNGRRVATHGLAGQTVDLNSIPFAAIDRVEVLRDGASAIYGTDAIGGVINFITRRDFQGARISGLLDKTQLDGADIYRGSVLVGHGNLDTDRWNVFGALSYKRNTKLRGDSRDFSNGNQPERGLVQDTRGAPFATLVRPGSSGVGITSILGSGYLDPARPGDTTRMTSINVLDLPGGLGCANGGPHMFPYSDQLWDFPAARYACAWDYAGAGVIQQPVDSTDFVGRATFRIGEGHELFAEVTAAKVKAMNEFEPQQLTTGTAAATAPSSLGVNTWYPLNDRTRDTYNMIYNQLANYFGAGQVKYGAPIAYRWRCMACGPREITTTTTSYRFLVGMTGNIGTWNYDTGLSRATSKSDSVLGTGYIYTDDLKQMMGSGMLNPFLLPGQEQAADTMAALKAASAEGVKLYGGQTTVTTFDASVSGDLPFFHLPGGAIAMATGIDLRREQYRLNGDQRSNKRDIYQAPFDNVYAMNTVTRDIKAAYVELHMPIFKNFDLNLAGRYDNYSGFGSTRNPKVSFKYRPIDSLLFRGAYSTGFKVPSFAQLFRGASEQQYVGLDLADPATCPGGKAKAGVAGCEVIRPDEIFGGKADLKPETSRQKSFGMVFSPTPRFNLALDWWEIERTNTIRPAAREVLIAYYNQFTSNWIRDSAGQVIKIDRRFINSGGSKMRGIELDTNLSGDVAGGRWGINLNGSYLLSFNKKDLEALPYSPNLVGKYVRYQNLPLRWKHTLSFSWSRGNWSHGLTQIYRAGYEDEMPISVAQGSYIPPQWDPKVKPYTVYNYSATWKGMKDMTLTFGIKNLLNSDPPFTAHQNDFASGAGWEPRVADPRGRAFMIMADYKLW